ncbi:MAG: hypothetical protein ACRDPW_05490 [Mycobacteriales bacterium]
MLSRWTCFPPRSVARRSWRAAAAALIAVVSLLLAVPAADAAPPDSEYSSSATMRFGGAVNLLGLLNSLTVSPSEVRVQAGGVVTFVNNSGVSLNLAVAGQTSTLTPGSSQQYDFPGSGKSQSFTASTTPLKAAVTGDTLRSTGTVIVAAASNRTNPGTSSSLPTPSRTPDSQQGGASSNPLNKAAQAPLATPDTAETSAAAGEQDTPAPPGTWQLAEAPMLDGLLQPDVSRTADGTEAAASRPGVLVTLTDNGQMGLMIVVAAVLVIGVSSAAMRVVVARRHHALRG